MNRPKLVDQGRSKTPAPAGELSPVDHFPEVLKHTNKKQLLALTRYFVDRTNEWPKEPWDDSIERAEMCLTDCTRRGLVIDLWGIQRTA